jgi:hypothetical protein
MRGLLVAAFVAAACGPQSASPAEGAAQPSTAFLTRPWGSDGAGEGAGLIRFGLRSDRAPRRLALPPRQAHNGQCTFTHD